MLWRVLAVALLVVVTSGCVADAPPVDVPAPSHLAGAANVSEPSREAPITPEPAADASEEGEAGTHREPVAYGTRTAGEVCLGVSSMEECVLIEGEDDERALPEVPRPLLLRVNVSWTASPTDLAANLFAVLLQDVDGEWDSMWEEGFVALAGPNGPLTIDWDLSSIPAGARLGLGLYYGTDGHIMGTVFLYRGLPGEFDVDGFLEYGPGQAS